MRQTYEVRLNEEETSGVLSLGNLVDERSTRWGVKLDGWWAVERRMNVGHGIVGEREYNDSEYGRDRCGWINRGCMLSPVSCSRMDRPSLRCKPAWESPF